MKKLTFLLGVILFIFLSMNICAQEQDLDVEIKEKMDVVLEHIDKSKIETGILADYGAWLIDPNMYNGVLSEENYTSLGLWKLLYISAYTSQINGNSNLKEPESVFNGLQNDSPAMLYLQYNSIDELAVEKGILTFENEQLRETGSGTSPYIKKELFAIALPDKEYKRSVSFTFRKENYIYNLQEMPLQMVISFDKNLPYQQVAWGQTIGYTYSSAGEKEISIRLKMANGSFVEGHALIQVVAGGPRLDAGKDPLDEKIRIPATNEHSGGEIQIKYATLLNDSTKEKQLMRPLIIADESDLSKLIYMVDLDLTYLLEDGKPIKEIIEKINQIYDIVYINNADGFDDIFRNAKLFEEAMRIINEKRGMIHDKNYVIGLGMGGLVARYALRDMERQGISHDVTKFITINSPHKGANIPVGLQALLRYLQNRKILNFVAGGLIDSVDKIASLFDKKAMQQMLVYTMNKKYHYLSDHDVFMQKYDGMGMPQQCENIAISNGSNNGMIGLQGGKQLFRHKNKAFGLDASAYSIRHMTEALFFSGAIKAFWFKIKKEELKSDNTMVAMDEVSGSLVSLNGFISSMGAYKNDFKLDEFCFVPTVSALGVNDWKNEMFSFLSLNSKISNFDRLYAAEENNGYEDLAVCKDALIEELAPLIKGGTASLVDNTEYRLINLPSMITSVPMYALTAIKWRITNDNFKVVSRSGEKVTIAPQVANSTAKLIAALYWNGITTDVDSVELSSMDFDIISENWNYTLAGTGNRFRVNIYSPNSTLAWSCSEGIQIKEQKDDYIVIAGCGIHAGWLQADLTTGGRKLSKRIRLDSEPLPGKLEISVSDVVWCKDNGEKWFLLHAVHKPCVSGETFEWSLNRTIIGSTCARFYIPPTTSANNMQKAKGTFTPIDYDDFKPDVDWRDRIWYERMNIDSLSDDYRILIFDSKASYTDVFCSLKSPCCTLDANKIVMSSSGEISESEVPKMELKLGDVYTAPGSSMEWQSVCLEHQPCDASKEEITWTLTGEGGSSIAPSLSKKRPVPFHFGGDTPTLYRDSIEAGHNEIFLVYDKNRVSYISSFMVHCCLKVGNNTFKKVIYWPEMKKVDVFPNPADGNIWIGGKRSGNEIGLTTENRIRTMSVASAESSSVRYSIRIYNNYTLVRSFDNVSLDVPFQVDTADLPNGYYYLNIIRDGQVIDRQLIIIKH